MNFPVCSLKGMTNPLFPGSCRIVENSFDNASKMRFRSGLEENFAMAHNTGFNNIVPSNFRMKTFVLLYGDHTDLHIHKFGQGRDLHRFSCRKIPGKIFTIHFIYFTKAMHIGYKNGRLHHIAEIHLRLLQYGSQVMHYLVGFFLYIFILQIAGRGINTNLPGNEQHIACLNSLVIGTNWRRGIRSFDDGFVHVMVLKKINKTNLALYVFFAKNSIMKIAVIADEALKKELTAQGIRDGVKIEWLQEIIALPHADVYIDLSFSQNTERMEELKKLQPASIIVNSVTTTLNELPENFIRINGWPGFLKRRSEEHTSE